MYIKKKRHIALYVALTAATVAFAGSRMASSVFIFGLLRELTGFFWVVFLSIAILALICSCRKAAIASFMLTGLSFGSMMASYPDSVVAPAEDPSDIVRIYQHNTYFKNEDFEETAEMMASGAHDSDIVFFQEVRPELFDAAEHLAGGRFPYRLMNKGEHYPVALFSRFVVIEHTFRQFVNGGRTFIDALLELPSGRRLRFIGAHLASPGRPDYYAMRNAQINELDTLLSQADPDIPLILAGDLNATLYSPHMRRLYKNHHFSGARADGASLGTWPSILPEPLRITIDHAFGMNGAVYAERRIITRAGSDHLPVHHVFSIVSPMMQ